MAWTSAGVRLLLGSCAALHLMFLSCALQAEVLQSAPGATRWVRAGFFCLSRPDDKVAAPDSTGGELNVYNDPFHFVHLGDAVPSVSGIGIGVVFQMARFRAGEELTIRSVPSSPGNAVETWAAAPNETGLVWLGYLGGEDTVYPPGLWRFEVLRGAKVIFAYQFQVLPAAQLPDLEGLCVAPVS